ncbi:hypothetical protein ACFW0F_05280 [Brucella anthropi]|uniref:hypothetical protein n=1 Tax=Brucella anthropi TaxID=529 RepID=UPI00366CB361
MADKLQPRLRPYLQGNLDSLCGVYALINGIRWALRNELVSDKGEHWEELFRKLTDHAIKSRGHLELVNDGLSLYGMIALTHVAQDHMREYHDIEVVMRRPFALRRPLEASESLNTISDHLAQPNTAVLAAVYGTLNHWCVIKQLDEQRAHLFDSDRLFRLPTSAFRPQEFIESHKRRAHVQPGSIIVMNISKR